jgi:hypothetical protein
LSDASDVGADSHPWRVAADMHRLGQQIATEPTARGFLGAALTIGSGEDDENAAYITRVAEEAVGDVRSVGSSMGWGGDTHAVTIVLDGLDRVGGVGGGLVIAWAAVRQACRTVLRIWRRLRQDDRLRAEPDLSVGAVAYLCIADLHAHLDGDIDGVRLVHCADLAGLDSGSFGFSGAGELYLFLFSRAGQTWLYLTTSRGRLLHRSIGKSVPPSMYSLIPNDGWDGPWPPAEYVADEVDSDSDLS